MGILQQTKPNEQNVLSSKYYCDHCTSYILHTFLHIVYKDAFMRLRIYYKCTKVSSLVTNVSLTNNNLIIIV